MDVTFTHVHAIYNELIRNGEKVTLRKIREKLGSGSFTTISEYIKQIKDVEETDEYVEDKKKSSIRYICTVCTLSTYLVLVFSLLIFQSVNLYSAIGFSNPMIISIGSILMVLGFSCFKAIKPSKISVSLCLYISLYECIFVFGGTYSVFKKQYETAMGIEMIEKKKQFYMSKYEKKLAEYNDENSKNYNNTWFEKKVLNPAWQAYEKENTNLIEKLENISSPMLDYTFILKVAYRLGLVLLSMVTTQWLVLILLGHKNRSF